ncbi:MAG: hypothetical protein Q7V63_03650 [Gammaproteobacteria bacterium]|nr:hypothetical protein [Gammaproteobacteria bacterium]
MFGPEKARDRRYGRSEPVLGRERKDSSASGASSSLVLLWEHPTPFLTAKKAAAAAKPELGNKGPVEFRPRS